MSKILKLLNSLHKSRDALFMHYGSPYALILRFNTRGEHNSYSLYYFERDTLYKYYDAGGKCSQLISRLIPTGRKTVHVKPDQTLLGFKALEKFVDDLQTVKYFERRNIS